MENVEIPAVERDVLAGLDALGIPYRVVHHAPVYTIADCEDVGAVGPKNLFLMPRHREEYYLVTVHPDARMNTGSVSKQLGSSRLSFAPEEKLTELTRAHNGSVTPLGLMFDAEKRVRFAIDEKLRSCDELAFHPCVNTATVIVKTADFFEKFLPATGHGAAFVTLEED